MSPAGLRIVERLIARRAQIAERWLERLEQHLDVQRTALFPTADVLDHIPETIDDLARLLLEREPMLAILDTRLPSKGAELGRLRFAQDVSVSQILQEHALLFDVLMDEMRTAASERATAHDDPIDADALAGLIGTMSRAASALEAAAVAAFMQCHAERARLQTERLQSLNGFMSHELRTPLQSAQLNLEMYRLETGQAGEQLDAVQSGLDRVVDLLNGLDGLAHNVAEESDGASRVAVDIGGVVSDVVDTLAESMSLRGIRFSRDADLGTLRVARATLDLVLSNLIGNAIKYSDPDKAERRVEVRRRPAPTDDMVAFAVIDNGLGIAEQQQAEVFQLRRRAHAERDDELAVSGKGFGLYLVAEAIAEMDGQLTLESEAGQGTRFTVCLPRAD